MYLWCLVLMLQPCYLAPYARNLNRCLIRHRRHSLRPIAFRIHCSFASRPFRLPLQEHVRSFGLRLPLLLRICLDPVQEFLP